MKKYNVITLCGSTKFKNHFIEINKWLTLQGNIVISVGLFGHSGENITIEDKVKLDDVHKGKIDLCDEIFVININDYIGSSTKSEIEYAIKNNKNIRYFTNEIVDFEKWENEYYNRIKQNWNIDEQKNKKIMGKIEIFKGSDDEFRFRILSNNGKIIASSEGYKTKNGCMNGIESVKENMVSDIIDLTLNDTN